MLSDKRPPLQPLVPHSPDHIPWSKLRPVVTELRRQGLMSGDRLVAHALGDTLEIGGHEFTRAEIFELSVALGRWLHGWYLW